ncbi:MAG TPA: S8 family serine peptidase [Solirubrobacteraceae bacterium]|nr:S8 family serine peptidase [Solirubrobacteraceae bacterium]
MPLLIPSPRSLVLAGLLAGVSLLAPAGARATAPRNVARPQPAYVPGEVIVRYAPGAGRPARAAAQRGTGTGEPRAFAPRTRALKIRDGESVRETIGELRRRPGVLSATPNWIARASAFVPDDPGQAGAPGGWQGVQWNFAPVTGINTPDAWERLNAVGRPGGLGVKVAVLDTGVAYASRRGFRRSPDIASNRFVQGYDFVDNDAFPDDHNGHGTHVASTIGETTGNGFGLTGVAYGTRIMPVRVLDRAGAGDSVAISAGIRYGARRGASVINLSFEFDSAVTRGEIPDIFDALRYARRRGTLVVGASGNFSAHAVAYPARAGSVLSVAATTEHLCQADYSNGGPDLDIAAPGGGLDAVVPGDPNCRPGAEPAGRDIFQVTFAGRSVKSFGVPGGYVGTSMAAPHVSGTAALVIASGVIGPNPTPAAIEARLKATARDLGTPGHDPRYGAGLIDAARAVTP